MKETFTTWFKHKEDGGHSKIKIGANFLYGPELRNYIVMDLLSHFTLVYLTSLFINFQLQLSLEHIECILKLLTISTMADQIDFWVTCGLRCKNNQIRPSEYTH